MPDPSLKYTPARMSIVNLTSGDELQAQFNPTELEEHLAVNYERLAVLGLSHMPMQYQQTQNLGFPIELAFRAFDDQGNRADKLDYARKFLYALCYPTKSSADVTTGAPPRALFLWPQLISVTCKVTELVYKHTLFNRQGIPVHSSAKISLEEIRDVRLFSEDVLANGTKR